MSPNLLDKRSPRLSCHPATRPVIALVALLLGLLQAVAFDFPFDSPWRMLSPVFSCLSLLGFLGILYHLTPKQALLFGYVFGLGTFGWGLNWIYISMSRFGGASLTFAMLANVAVVAYLALYWLLAAYLIVKLGHTPNRRLLLAAPIIALLEWVRSVFLIGFPWLSIGYGFIDTPLAQWASVGGLFLLSFIVILALALLLLEAPKYHHQLNRRLFLVGGLIMTLTIPQWLQLLRQTASEAENLQMPQTPMTLALVQGNMPVITAYSEQRIKQNLNQYKRLTDDILARSAPNIVIWPESAIPYFYIESQDFLANVYLMQITQGFDLITGVPHGDWRDQDAKSTHNAVRDDFDSNSDDNTSGVNIYNSILLQTRQDPTPQFYNKQHLLPFGEYLPFRSVLAFFEDFVSIPMSDFARGDVVQRVFEAGGLTFAPSICFEAVFGNEIRQNAINAQILLNISNDAWFGKSKAQAQHLNIARLRAIENHKILVRSTNDGITAIIAADGQVIKSLPPFTEGILTTQIIEQRHMTKAVTLYTKYGDTPWLMLFIAWIVVVFISQKKNVTTSLK